MNALSSIGIYFDEKNVKNVSKILENNINHTNNSAELQSL